MPHSALSIEVAYALPDQQVVVKLNTEAGITLRQAIERSGLLRRFPEIDLGSVRVGVFGKARDLDDPVNVGDRIEIYRGLTIDPKEMRRQRAINKL